MELVKEPDNEHDGEVKKVFMDGLGHIGYFANYPRNVIGKSCSTRRFYDKIEDGAVGKVKYVIGGGVLCEGIEGYKRWMKWRQAI